MNRTLIASALVAGFFATLTAQTADARERNRSGSYENSAGQSGTFQSSRETDRAAGTHTINRSATREDGVTASSARTVTRTGEGVGTFNGNHQGFNGRSIETQGTVTRTESGSTTTGIYSTSDGRSGSFDSATSRSDGQRTTTTNWTGANGQTTARESVDMRTDDGFTRTTTVTGPNGQSRENTTRFTGNPSAP